jgi:hypothetical protein
VGAAAFSASKNAFCAPMRAALSTACAGLAEAGTGGQTLGRIEVTREA